MEILIWLLVICAIVAVFVWLISLMSFFPTIVKSILQTIVVLAAIIKVLSLLQVYSF